MKIENTFKILTIILFIFSFKVNSQTIVIKEDNVKLKFIKSKKASKIINSSSVYIKSKKLKRILVKIKMKSLNNKKQIFDPNKFSLIDFNYKLRYKPTDILFQNLTDWWHFEKISKTKPKRKFNKRIYSPDINDTFLDYKFEGIKNVIIPINFATKKKPDIHIIHFKPKKLRSRNIYIYFPFPKELKNAVLYYGNEKITNINFK